VPGIFGLAITAGGEVFGACSLVWRNGERVGARFPSANELRERFEPAVSDPKPAEVAFAVDVKNLAHETPTGRSYFSGWSSLLIHPAALDLSGSDTSTSSSVWAHFRHLNVRRSKPSGPSETATVIIRVWHLEQRGRWIGKSSGSGFLQLPMTAKIAPALNICLSGCRRRSSKIVTSIERDADAIFFAPGDMARSLQLIGPNNQRESVRNVKRAQDFERCPSL